MNEKIKLSIIVVSWNVRTLLEACLTSVFTHAPQFPFEVIVIDNASHDTSVDMIAQKFPQVNCIANMDNRGFAVATNQGIRIARGEHILFLNPDTEVKEGSLEKLISFIESDSRIGIVAPKILNPDGSLQPSIRRFPTSLSQLFILFKLSHLRHVPGAIQRYLNEDFDYGKTQDVEQPQGAAFLVRRSVFDTIGLLDENFFIWFEEVDFCKRTQDAGYRIVYTPESEIVHHGGQSFRQRFSIDRQILFYTSCARYLWKHFSWKSAYVVIPMKLYCMILHFIKNISDCSKTVIPTDRRELRNLFFTTLAFIATAELFSLFGFISPPFVPFGFFLIVICIGVLSFFKLEYGVMAVVAELIIGSKGYLLSFSIGETSISIRHAFFAILFLVWVFHAIKKRVAISLPRYLLFPYVLLGIVVVFSIVQGYASGNSRTALFHDANAWVFFLILFPFFAAIVSHVSIRRIFSVVCAAFIAHVVKVLVIFYMMGHQGFGTAVLETVYRWARVTGIAEITPFESNVFRVFFQSEIYALIAFCILLAYAGVFFFKHPQKSIGDAMQDFFKKQKAGMVLFIGTVSVLMVSFSRSFWLAAACAGLAWLAVVLFLRYKIKTIAMTCSVLVIGVIASGVFLFGFSRFPFPVTSGGFDFGALTRRTGNVSDEAAAASRWSSLPVLVQAIKEKPLFGYGFGKELTYVSQDPRILEANPSGVYTTYAFEWGYLDMVVKFGIVGLACYLFFLVRILARGWWNVRASPRAFGIWLGLIAVMVTHMFSPYLNHPLGIGYVVLAGVLFDQLNKEENLR